MTAERTHAHLTEKQVIEIREVANTATFDNAQQDSLYLWDLAVAFIDSMSIEDQISAVSNDPDMLPHLLTFDPKTGKKWPEE